MSGGVRKRTIRLVGGVMVAAAVICSVLTLPTHAEPPFSWLDPAIHVEYADDLPDPGAAPLDGCHNQQVHVEQQPGMQSVCVYDGEGFQYGTAVLSGPYTASYVLAVRIGRDQTMHVVNGMQPGGYISMPYSKDMLFRATGYGGFSSWAYIITDFVSQLEPVKDSTFMTSYKLKTDAAKPLIRNEGGGLVNTWALGASADGRWVILEVDERGFLRFDTKMHTIRWYSNQRLEHYTNNSRAEFAISDDGRRIAMAGQSVDPVVTELDETCGRTVTYFDTAWRMTDLKNPCPQQNLVSTIHRFTGDYLNRVVMPRFDTGGGELVLFMTPFYRPGVEFREHWLRLTAANYASPRFDYLALGDSFSSGEGDLQLNPATGQKYYREYTDVAGGNGLPEEKCHVSSRSYPYLLAASMHIGAQINKKWQTVACSGAVVRDDYNLNLQYQGQKNRHRDPRLFAMRTAIDAYKMEAGDKFIPGRIPQLDFIKNTQPKILTLTGGGNDIGFGDILRYCASSLGTCDYATSPDKKAQLASTIQAQYQVLTDLYTKIHTLSPETKIYAIGYPQFFSGDDKTCELNVRLTTDERRFVREGVIYLNKVIQAAAQSAGVKYIDIEDAFGTHVLCGNDEPYVNGVNLNCLEGTLLGPASALAGTDECAESFHPNSKGQAAIAETILRQVNGNLATYRYCAKGEHICPTDAPQDTSATTYFSPSANLQGPAAQTKWAALPSADIQKGAANTIDATSLAPSTTAHITLHSSPIDLGNYITSADGTLAAVISIPATVPAGYHTLYIETKTPSGEPITLWQIVRVLGRSGDVDEDGVADGNDKCLFIPDSHIDVDGDGIDDACDPEIGEARLARAVGSETTQNSSRSDSEPLTFTASRSAQTVDSAHATSVNEEVTSQMEKMLKNIKEFGFPGIMVSISAMLGIIAIILRVFVLRKRYAKTTN